MKTGISRYFDDMAEEEEDDDVKKMEAARRKLEEDEREMKSEIKRQDRRRNQENMFKGENADVAGVVNSLQQRYHRTAQLAHDLEFDDGIPFATPGRTSLATSRHAATRQAHAPSLTDPRLWVLPCKTGCEYEAVLSLMKKCNIMAREGYSMSRLPRT